MKSREFKSSRLLLVWFFFLTGCQAVTAEKDASPHSHVLRPNARHGPHTAGVGSIVSPHSGKTPVLDLGSLTDIGNLVEALASRQVIFVGEAHDRYEHHLNQLEIIQGLHARHPDLVIGMEYFQQPFQSYLDQFVAGQIDEKQLLRKTEYFERWRYDYRLYRPILDFARNNGIPILALNVPKEITEKVARTGVESLSEAERAQIPAEMDRSDEFYRKQLSAVFKQHPPLRGGSFENFLDAQLTWDEGMAQRISAYFGEKPNGHMLVLAGSGHLIFGAGIPARVKRRVPVEMAIVISGTGAGLKPGIADYVLLPEKQRLPRSGLLGVILDTDGDAVRVKAFSDNSPAEKAGLSKGDRIVRIGDEPISSYADIKIALMDQNPGGKVRVEVRRKRLVLPDEQLSYEVLLY